MLESQRLAARGVNVHDTGENFASGQVANERGAAPRRLLRHLRVGSALKTSGRLRTEAQRFRTTANGDRIKPGSFQQHASRCETDFGFRAAHNSADTDSASGVTNDAGIRRQSALDAIE